MRRAILSPSARADLSSIWSYIFERNPSAADRQLERFFECFDTLAKSPLLGQTRDDLQPGVRMFCKGNYVIYYSVEESSIHISRVLHGRRDEKTAWSET